MKLWAALAWELQQHSHVVNAHAAASPKRAHFSNAPSPKLCFNALDILLCRCGLALKKCLLKFLSEICGKGVTHKTHLTRVGCFSLMTWEAKVRYRQFSGPSFSKSDVVGGAATSAANIHDTDAPPDAEEVRQNVGGGSPWRGIVPRPHCFERFPLGAAATVTPAWIRPWLRLDLGSGRYQECWFHRCFQPIMAISLDVTGAWATVVGLRVATSRLVSPARCCCRGFWAATHLPLSVRLRCPLSSFGVSVDCLASCHNR